MTDRLAHLLQDEATALEIPPAATDRIITQGRGIQRRRRTTIATAFVVVLAAVLVGLIAPGSNQADNVPPAGTERDEGWAVASGSTVQLGTGSVVELDAPVGYLFSTSVGVLANYGGVGGSTRWVLIRSDGTTTDFRLDVGTQLVGTDPAQPYMVYVEATDSPTRWNVVVRDLRTNEVADTIPFEGSVTWTNDATPDAFLVGNRVYVNTDSTALSVDLTTRRVTPVDSLPAAVPLAVEGRHAIVEGPTTFTENNKFASETKVVDIDTGKSVMKFHQEDRYLELSPDGRHAAALPMRTCDDDNACEFTLSTGYVYDLSTGHRTEIEVEGATAGWTRSGGLVLVTKDEISVCDPDSGACRSTPRKVPASDTPVLADKINW